MQMTHSKCFGDYTVEKDTIFNTDTFEAGDLVVQISYYKLIDLSVEGGFRSYEPLDGMGRSRSPSQDTMQGHHICHLVTGRRLLFSDIPEAAKRHEL